jgi:DNA-directed RNA polymerase subunit M/transcription elongation factor TFIIS
MIFCPTCDNLTKLHFETHKLYYQCGACKEQYELNDEDTLVEENAKIHVIPDKSGKSIFNYPSNPKLYKTCINKKCKQTILAYELYDKVKKIYGCGGCNQAWIDTESSI